MTRYSATSLIPRGAAGETTARSQDRAAHAVAAKGLSVDPDALTEAVRLTVATAMAEARYPMPATKSVDPTFVTRQLEARRSYLRLLAVHMGLDAEDVAAAMVAWDAKHGR